MVVVVVVQGRLVRVAGETERKGGGVVGDEAARAAAQSRRRANSALQHGAAGRRQRSGGCKVRRRQAHEAASAVGRGSYGCGEALLPRGALRLDKVGPVCSAAAGEWEARHSLLGRNKVHVRHGSSKQRGKSRETLASRLNESQSGGLW